MIRKLITLLLITVVQAPMLSAFAQEMAVPATTEVEDRYSVKCKVIDKDENLKYMRHTAYIR